MSRYIDADALKEQMLKYGFHSVDQTVTEFVEDTLPTADVVEVKHGRWIKDRLCSTSGGTYEVRRCSVCEHYFQDLVNEYNYCPNCGADMREENNELYK